MKQLRSKLFPALALGLATTCAIKSTRAETSMLWVTAAKYVPYKTPNCVVVGKCEFFGNIICTDDEGNTLHTYFPLYGTCLPVALGTFVSEIED